MMMALQRMAVLDRSVAGDVPERAAPLVAAVLVAPRTPG
jgi:hypothetical protein